MLELFLNDYFAPILYGRTTLVMLKKKKLDPKGQPQGHPLSKTDGVAGQTPLYFVCVSVFFFLLSPSLKPMCFYTKEGQISYAN